MNPQLSQSFPETSEETLTKLAQLKSIIDGYGSVAVAFSGGVDSTFLLVFVSLFCPQVHLVAITADGTVFDQEETAFTKEFCKSRHIDQLFVSVNFREIPGFVENGKERCYFCKQSIFSNIVGLANSIDIKHVADGSNMDDTADFRPGFKALAELGIQSPLLAANLSKAEIRHCLKALNIPGWDKPPFPCLATRIPYDEHITEEKLAAVGSLEHFIRSLGFVQVRARHHGSVVRIEVSLQDMHRFCQKETMASVLEMAKKVGFKFAALDLAGYKTGSMNS